MREHRNEAVHVGVRLAARLIRLHHRRCDGFRISILWGNLRNGLLDQQLSVGDFLGEVGFQSINHERGQCAAAGTREIVLEVL